MRTVVLVAAAGAGVTLATRLAESGPWTVALLSVAAGTVLALCSTRRPAAVATAAGALAGFLLVVLTPAPVAGAAFAAFAWAPRAHRTGSPWDAALVVCLAAAGGAVAPLIAAAGASSTAFAFAATVLAGLALVGPSVVPEATQEVLDLRRAARAVSSPARETLRRSAALAERIARSDAPAALKDRACELAGVLATDGRALGRLAEVRALEGRLARPSAGAPARRLLEERRDEITARLARMSGVLERAWVTGEAPPLEPRVRVVEELERETEATEHAHEVIARMGYD